jgi:hydroxymethylbilane synthase
MGSLRIGTRGSQLALWQANHVAERLRERGHSVEIEIIKTTGDKMTDVSLSQIGTKGMFIKEIEEALAANRVDLAVHSLKDVPTELHGDFEMAAILARQDARDAFVSARFADLASLPQHARVGTSSLRRSAQLKALRSDLELLPLRGNVDTRLRKLESGEYDAIILAAAGLHRLGLTKMIRETFPPSTMCPAAGQGALGIEIRAGDTATKNHLAFLDDTHARATTDCERAALNALGGGCQVPIGAYAEIINGKLRLTAVVARPDGQEILREQQEGPATHPQQLGARVGRALRDRGADRILAEIYQSTAVAPQQP